MVVKSTVANNMFSALLISEYLRHPKLRNRGVIKIYGASDHIDSL